MDIQQDTDARIIEEIMRSIRQIRYGEVVVTVHDAKVVQIEKTEKKRFYE